MNESKPARLPWARVVELAAELESSAKGGGHVDREAALRLARAVLVFQGQLLGDADWARLVRPR